MKKIINIATIAVFALLLSSCERFLDSTNYWSKSADNFPGNVEDAEQMITGIYNNLNVAIGDKCHLNYFLWSNAASDDCLGGGGNNDQAMQAEDLMLNFGADMYDSFYTARYKGIARANLAIETLESCGVDENTLKQYMGEAYFLRAFFMYELGSMFGNIPYPTASTADPTLPQVSGEELWGQVLQDLKRAADMMPAKAQKGSGHVDKYCAEALLGRVYLFYSGMYSDENVTMPEDGELTKAEVGAYITDCVNNSGYELVSDFHNLWAYTNRCTVEDDLSPFKGNDYSWAENDAKINPEAMFMIKFNTQPSWSTTIGYSNQQALFCGVRQEDMGAEQMFPFGQGWGMCQVSPQLVADWKAAEPTDPRREASIIAVNSAYADKGGVKALANGTKSYNFGKASFVQETGYYLTKTMPVVARKEDGSSFWASFSNAMYSLTWSSQNEDNFQLNSINDHVLIRFAEVLLMDAELNNNQASFDKVRSRAGLASKPINEENIRNERRWELAFEGVRFNDLRRYGESYAAAALDKQEGVACWNVGIEGTNTASKYNGGYGNRYKATKGFVSIPSNEISLSANAGAEYKFTQNEGWGTADSQYAGW